MLVGSVAGQRYWSSMLSLDARITSGCWTPDDSQVYLGTASAQLVVMDVHGAMVSQVTKASFSHIKRLFDGELDIGPALLVVHVVAGRALFQQCCVYVAYFSISTSTLKSTN